MDLTSRNDWNVVKGSRSFLTSLSHSLSLYLSLHPSLSLSFLTSFSHFTSLPLLSLYLSLTLSLSLYSNVLHSSNLSLSLSPSPPPSLSLSLPPLPLSLLPLSLQARLLHGSTLTGLRAEGHRGARLTVGSTPHPRDPLPARGNTRINQDEPPL